MKLKTFINNIINLIYPNICGFCEEFSTKDLCIKCNLKLNKISNINVDIYNDKYFKKHMYIFKYEGLIKEKLLNYKFNNKSYIYKSFVDFFINNEKIYSFLKSYDIIIPVPIHKYRKIIRGYNQSALICKKIAKKINLGYCDDVLYKNTNNKPQSTKNKEERIKNVIGVYKFKNEKKIIGKNILVFDDIYTTGSTVNECAKILIQARSK